MLFPVRTLQASLYPEQEIRRYKDPSIIKIIKKELKYVKEKVWPWLQKLKGYGKFKWPDDIYVSDNLPQNVPAMTMFKKDWLGRIKKYLVVSKDILLYPIELIRHALLHEGIHTSRNVPGDLISEIGIDKTLVDVYRRMGDERTARMVEKHSGYLSKLYGLLGKILTPLTVTII